MSEKAETVHVLVVDDVSDTNLVTSGLLESLGCEVDAAESGREALDLIGRNKYQLILLDCHMPLMDGYEVVKIIRDLPAENPTSSRVPVIGLTALAYAGEEQKSLAAGMDECLGKPVSRARLLEVLDRWTEGARRPAPRIREPAARKVAPSPRFQQLVEQLGSELMARVMKLYLVDLMPRVAALEAAIGAGDAAAARQVAHALKAASGNVGALELERLGARMEEAADALDLALLGSMLAPLRSEANRALQELSGWIRG
jgi:CheY-like chemotaxis protein/HPt (histidine-containing phosphotransfer) domain-containing protein